MKQLSKQLSKSETLAARNTHAALTILDKNGGDMRYSEICQEMETIRDFSDYEKEHTKSGYPRWKIYLQFFSIELSIAGYIIRNKGMWHLTEEGQAALKKSPEEFYISFHSKYKEYTKQQKKEKVLEDKIDDIEEVPNELEDLQGRATAGIIDYINQKNPYDFQELVAALLRAMGYYTPFIAPKGKDGGIDIIAYQDPLGTTQPQLKVQVKHYPKNPISVDVVRSLGGVLVKEGEVGLLVTSGTFTNEAKKEARNYHRRLRLIDIDEFIELWIRYYDKMVEADKLLLPIIPIYFIKQY